MKAFRLTRFLSDQRTVNLKYSEIGSSLSVSDKLYEAFGKEGQGLLIVSEVPRLMLVRQRFFQQSSKLQQLTEDEKFELSNPWSGYKLGWNEEKTVFGEFRASFTANPIEDINGDLSNTNLWPSNLPYFRSHFRALGQILIKTASLLSSHLDHFLDMHFPYSILPRFESTIDSSSSHLATLTHSSHFKPVWETKPNIFSVLISPVYQNKKNSAEPHHFLIVQKQNNAISVRLSSDSVCFIIGKAGESLSDGIFECKPYSEIHENKFSGLQSSFSVQLAHSDSQLENSVSNRCFARFNNSFY